MTFAGFIERAFGQLRQYVAGDQDAALHSRRTLGEVATACSRDEPLDVLRAQAGLLLAPAKEELGPALLTSEQRRVAELRLLLEEPAHKLDENKAPWLGGTADA